MSRQEWVGAFLVTLIAGSWVVADEPQCCAPGRPGIFQRWHPVGGWNPYGSGLLHWWNPDCFPRCGAPDDYCRKTLPRVCWPAYPSYFIWGPPEVCYPPGNSCSDCSQPH